MKTVEEIALKTAFDHYQVSVNYAMPVYINNIDVLLNYLREAFKNGFIAGCQHDREPLDAVSKYIKSQPSANLEIKHYPKFGPYDSMD